MLRNFGFPKKLMMFFFISHVTSYIYTTFQTIWIVAEIRKAAKR